MISVIIPLYDRAERVQRAIRSVLNQSCTPGEVIVVDDGSTDGSRAIIPAAFPTVRYIWQENQGVSAARNRGIAEARGEWLAFLDSDDEWLPRKLERQMEALAANPDMRICHTNEIWIRRGRRVNPGKRHQKFGGYIYQKCLPLCIISPSSVLIHNSVFQEIGFFDTSLPACEDYDFWLRACSKYPVLYLDEALIIKYGGHPDQLSRKYPGMDRFRIRALEKMLLSGELSREDYLAALKMLEQKIDIYVQGALKRGKMQEVQELLRMKAFFADPKTPPARPPGTDKKLKKEPSG